MAQTRHKDIIVKKVPKMTANLGAMQQLKNVELGDLLGRNEVNLELNSIKKMLSQKTILITGAGGSIGSELAHQICLFSPQLIIVFDQSEYNLYQLEKALQSHFPSTPIECVIGDMRQKGDLAPLFQKYSPHIIFHSAAYKHVPMMEKNPWQAIYTNIVGTKNICELSHEYEVEKFVLVSTDKAVNPTNIMGTTKRIAEMLCHFQQKLSSKTQFMTVRFGNVLGSSGSVIPLFEEQIKEGGPLTVTHPKIKRFFMSLSEAASLVIQAGTLGKGGEIFVLDMGEPVEIVELAKQMIELAGLEYDKDIKITFTGLRQGEKLFEECLMSDEGLLTTPHPLVKIARAREVASSFQEELQELIKKAKGLEVGEVKKRLQKLVPEYQPYDDKSSFPSNENINEEEAAHSDLYLQ